MLHDPAYRETNAGALRMEWPRVPGWPYGEMPEAAHELAQSSAKGRELAALLDPDTSVPGVTTGGLRPEMAAIAVPSATDGGNMGRNVPDAVWGYKLGGYQVLKKWLSYRERRVTGRPLLTDEVQYFTDTARRIAAILLLVNHK